MSIPKTKFRIEGEDASGAAWKSALGTAQSAAGRMKTIFTTAVAGLSFAAITATVGHAIELGDELGKIQAKAGITGKAASELAHAFKMADLETSALSTSFKKMQVSLSQANSGGKAQIETLEALGLTIADLKGMAPDKQFELLADRISRLKDPADRTRAAVELFGKAGADLLPMFENGAEGIRQAREEAVRLGQSLTDEQIKRLGEADDAIKRMKGSWEGFATSMTSKVAPALTQVFDLLSGQAEDDLVQHNLKNAEEVLKKRLAEGANPADIYASQQRVAELRAKAGITGTASGGSRPGHRGATAASPGYIDHAAEEAAQKRAEKAAADIKKIQEESASWSQDLTRQTEEFVSDGAQRALEDDEERAAARLAFFEDNERRQLAVYVETQEKMSVEAEQAGRNMQDALSAFLFDPFDKGLKGMLRGFIDTIRQMIAQGAAADIFDSMGGGTKVASRIGTFAKGLLGFADGGDFRVGGSGGTDSQLVAFHASPDETVSIRKPGQGGGGDVHIHNHIDARGATTDLAAALPAILEASNRRAVQMARAQIFDDLSRRGGRR